MKKTLFYILAIALVLLIIFLIFRKTPAAGLTLFYGQECPHCARIEQFLQENKVDEKIKIDRKEVYHDQANAYLLSKTARKCAITGGEMGVPLLWDGSSCYVGEDQVRNFFQPYVK